MSDSTTAAAAHLAAGANPEAVLESLRRKADTVFTNYDGDTMWLKQLPHGITDCCLVEYPCNRHRPVPVRDGWGACKHGNGFPCPICMEVPAGFRGLR